MSEIKKFVIKEIRDVLREEKHKHQIKKLSSILFEAVDTANMLKDNPKKSGIAKKVVKIAEGNLIKEYHKEGEGRMFKAQLLSIMHNAKQIYEMIDEHDEFEDWLQSKVTIAEDYLRAIHGYMKYYNGDEDMGTEFEDEIEYDEKEMNFGDDETEEYAEFPDEAFDSEDMDDEIDSDEIWDDDDGEAFDYFIDDEEETI
jgi:hypothetical protein